MQMGAIGPRRLDQWSTIACVAVLPLPTHAESGEPWKPTPSDKGGLMGARADAELRKVDLDRRLAVRRLGESSTGAVPAHKRGNWSAGVCALPPRPRRTLTHRRRRREIPLAPVPYDLPKPTS